MNVIIPIVYIILFLLILVKSRFFNSLGISSKILISLFAIKILSAFALHYIYTFYYTNRLEADIFKYFDDAYILFQALCHSPLDFARIFFGFDVYNPSLDVYYSHMNFWTRKFNYGLFNDNQTIIRINSIAMLFSWGNIYVHHIFSAFISLFASALIYKVWKHFFPLDSKLLIITIFLIPSVVFWSSGMLKECIVMLGLGVSMYGLYFIYCNKYNFKSYVLLFLGLAILSCIKMYVLFAILPVVLIFIFQKFKPSKSVFRTYLIFYIACIILIILNYYLQIIPILENLVHKRNNFILSVTNLGNAGSYIDIGILKPEISAIITETPFAFARALLLPMFWHISHILHVLPAIENILLCILILLVIFFRKKQNVEQSELIWFSVFFSIGLLWIIGITTPVIGAIVRYKIPILPFIYSTCIVLIDWQLIKQKIKLNNGNHNI